MTRIRYKKLNSNVLVSNEILCNNEFVQIELKTDDLSYVIFNTQGALKTGIAENLAGLKKKAKTIVKELGANFTDEIRSKNKKLELHDN
jgi:hypothetical protein